MSFNDLRSGIAHSVGEVLMLLLGNGFDLGEIRLDLQGSF